MSRVPFDEHIQRIGISRYDEFFQSYYTPISSVKSVRRDYVTKEDNFLSVCGVAASVRDATIVEGMKAMTLVFAANHNGDFTLIEYELLDRSPFLYVNKHKLARVESKVYDSFMGLVEVTDDIEGRINRILGEFREKDKKLE